MRFLLIYSSRKFLAYTLCPAASDEGGDGALRSVKELNAAQLLRAFGVRC